MPGRDFMGSPTLRESAFCAMLSAFIGVSVAHAQPRGGEHGGGHGGPGGGRPGGAEAFHGGGHGIGGQHAEGRGFAGPHVGERPGGFAGNRAWHAHDFAGRDALRFHGYAGGFDRGRFGGGDWVRGGWHGSGPFLAYAGGRDSWDWRGAWGGGYGSWGQGFDVGWGGWAWGGIALGAGIGFIVAPPVYVLPPPIYLAPPPVVLGLPAIAPPPFVEGPAVVAEAAPPVVATGPSTADIVAASVPPPIVVSPPPYVVAQAPPPPVIFAPTAYAYAIAPPVLAFSVIGPAYYSGGFFTGGYIARGYYGAVWDRPYLHSSFHYTRPGFFARVGLGGVFGGERRGYERVDHFYGAQGGTGGGGWEHGDRDFHGGGGHFEHGGGEGHRGRERG
jgi:hypothetical protein